MAITDILNQLNQLGFFSYVLPFLLIFAVVYAILEKTNILARKEKEEGKEEKSVNNKGLLAIISAAIGLLSLQYDIVPLFFAELFPNFGIALSLAFVFLILAVFIAPQFLDGEGNTSSWLKWIGVAVGGILVIYTLLNWNTWFGYGGLSWSVTNLWYSSDFWTIIVLGIVGLAIYLATKN